MLEGCGRAAIFADRGRAVHDDALNAGPWRERPPFWTAWPARPAATAVVAHATLVLDRAASDSGVRHDIDEPSTSILRFTNRALKALRFAVPALRAAGGPDRAVREPSDMQVRRPHTRGPHTRLTSWIRFAILEVSSAVARCAAPPHRPMRCARIGGPRSRFVLVPSKHSWLIVRATSRPRIRAIDSVFGPSRATGRQLYRRGDLRSPR